MLRFRWTMALIALVSGALLAACGLAAGQSGGGPLGISGQNLTAAPSSTPTLTLTLLPTATPTATPLPEHPLMIEVMRRQSYPGSQIVFEEVLPPDMAYDRYVVSYQSEGSKIYAYMTIPRGERPATGWPVIIFNHGFIPPSVYRTTERYIAYQHGFASHGYIVFRSDYRGHGSSEGAAVGGYGSPAYTVDVLNGVASVKTYPDADPSRIGMWGHSMGGQITLRAMVVTEDVRAGVIWGGVVGSYPDLIEHWWSRRDGDGPTPTPNPTSTRGRWRTGLIDVYGTPQENPEFWAAISPNTYVADLSGPIQLHHSTTDESVPFVLSELLYGEVLAVGIPVEFYVYEGDDHDITNNFSLAMLRSIEFFDRYVKGGS